MTKSRSFSDKFKATVALEALRGDKTAQEIAAKHKVHPTRVTTWKRQAINGLPGVFSDKVQRAENNGAEVKEPHAKIGKMAVEKDFFVTGAKASSESPRFYQRPVAYFYATYRAHRAVHRSSVQPPLAVCFRWDQADASC